MFINIQKLVYSPHDINSGHFKEYLCLFSCITLLVLRNGITDTVADLRIDLDQFFLNTSVLKKKCCCKNFGKKFVSEFLLYTAINGYL